jgi:hypothetical protein
MKQLLLLMVSFILMLQTASAQEWMWGRKFHENEDQYYIRHVKSDQQGNSYFVTFINQRTMIDGIAVDSGYVIAKMDPAGTLRWSQSIPAVISDIAVTPVGDVYFCGYADTSIMIGNTQVPCKGQTNYFYGSISNAGIINWVESGGKNASSSWVTAIHVDNDGSIYLGGAFNDYLYVGSSVIQETMRHYFVIKVDPSTHQLAWKYFVDPYYVQDNGLGPGGIWINGIDSDKDGNIYFGGSYGGMIIFTGGGPYGGTYYPGDYLASVDKNGQYRIATMWGAKEDFYGLKVTGNGNVYVNGCDCSQYGSDTYLTMFDTWLVRKWTMQFEDRYVYMPAGITADSLDNVYVAANFVTDASIDGAPLPASPGAVNIFIAKIDPMGHVAWARTTTGKGRHYVESIGSTPGGQITISGVFYKKIGFGNTSLSIIDSTHAESFISKVDGSSFNGLKIVSISDSFLCVQDSFQVAIKKTGVYGSGNSYTVLLSDSLGNNIRTIIGLKADTASGLITCRIPPDLNNGSKYKIRVTSSDPLIMTPVSEWDLSVSNPRAFFPPMTYQCVDGAPIELTLGVPAGGTYYGNGVSNNYFDPAAAGVGVTEITYVYESPYGCLDTAKRSVPVIYCVGVEEVTLNDVQIYPNPTAEKIFITSPAHDLHYELFDCTGRIVSNNLLNNSEGIDVSMLESGNYYVRFYDDVLSIVKSFVVSRK